MRRSIVPGILLLAVLAAESPAGPSLAAQVNRAIDRGVERIRTWQREDGSFDAHYHGSYPSGNTALHLYTLLKSGVSPDDPQVRMAIEYLRYRPLRKTYSTAVLIMALDAMKRPAFGRWIHDCARWLEEGFNEDAGLWAYPGHHHDLSNTQYGVLGLWAAERHGYRATTETWGRLLDSLLEHHLRDDGGFAYRPGYTQTGSMTTAAITVLTLALARVPEDDLRYRAARRKATKALEGAWAWMDRRMAVHGNPLGGFAFTRNHHYYYLFGLERVAAIAKRKQIGGRDWYREGARHLVANQNKDGIWLNSYSTCFALLFLRRATFTGMEGPVDPVDGDGVPEPPPAPKSPGADVPFIRRWLVLGPIDNPDDGGLYREFVPEAEVAPRPNALAGKRKWKAVWNLTDDVDLTWATFPGGEHKLAYAFTYLRIAADTDAVLWIGHDDDCRVFLDGTLIYDHHFHEARRRDTVKLHVKFTAGVHRLLLKVCNVTGPHGLAARVALPDGKPVPGLRPSLVPDGADLAETALAQPGFFPLHALADLLPLDRLSAVDFRKPDSIRRVALESFYPRAILWFPGAPEADAREGPSPGAEGVLRLHPGGKSTPARVYRRVPLPNGVRRVRVRVCADAHAKHGGRVADGVLRISVYDGTKLHRITESVVGGHAEPSAANWVDVEGDLRPFAGQEVLLVVECANGGRTSWWAEDLYLDEIAVLTH